MDLALAVIDALLEEFGDEWQAKCLTWLRQRYDNFGEIDKARLDNVLSGTGCEVLFAKYDGALTWSRPTLIVRI